MGEQMTAFDYIQLHPWWTLVYLCVGGSLLVGALQALRGDK